MTNITLKCLSIKICKSENKLYTQTIIEQKFNLSINNIKIKKDSISTIPSEITRVCLGK
jgi:hypothetical protein